MNPELNRISRIQIPLSLLGVAGFIRCTKYNNIIARKTHYVNNIVDTMSTYAKKHVIIYLKEAIEITNTNITLIEIVYLLSTPGMKEKLLEGKNTPIEECVPEDEVEW